MNNWQDDVTINRDARERDRKFHFGHVQFEMLIRYPSRNIESRVGYMSLRFGS